MNLKPFATLAFAAACATAEPAARPHHPDAPAIARDMGVSVQEAERRLAAQEGAGAMQQRLLQDPNFAGLYIEQRPRHRIVVMFIGADPSAQLARYTRDPLYEALPARYSEQQLHQAQEQLNQALMRERIHFMISSTNVQANRVEFEVVDENQTRALAAEHGVQIPESVIFISRGGIVAEAQRLPPVEHFPQARYPAGVELTALARGQLVVVNGCLRIQGPDGAGSLIIWPSSAVLERDSNRIVVRDRQQGTVVALNDMIEMGGGQAESLGAPFLTAPIPETCAGPYWAAGTGWRRAR
jgi:hypothetical protein